jgi:hypothetical protein
MTCLTGILQSVARVVGVVGVIRVICGVIPWGAEAAGHDALARELWMCDFSLEAMYGNRSW